MYKKKPKEIEKILEGGRLLGEILEHLMALVQPGISAWEIDQKAEQMIRDVGGIPAFKGYKPKPSDTPFPTTICASVNDEVVHGIATKDKILKEGDLFSIDIGMEYPVPGFFTDTAVTVPVGKISKEAKKLMDATRESLYKGIAKARVGNTIAAIGKAVEEYINPLGYGIVRDLVGHGVGHAVHEEPHVPNYYDPRLEEWGIKKGVVIAIEPMITAGDYRVQVGPDGWSILTRDHSLSAHFEHTIIVTDKGPVVATKRPSENIKSYV